jgi:hypothetical protein
MPRPTPENELLLTSLARLGVKACVQPWDEPLRWETLGMVVVRTTWDYYTRLDEFLGWARWVDTLTSLRNPVATLEWNSHKRYLLRLGAAGVPVPPTTLIPRHAPATRLGSVLGRHGDSDVVLKPAVAIGARGALRAPADSAVAANHLATLASAGDVLVQPLVDSVLTRGESSLVFFGGQFSHAVRKVPAKGDYRVHERYGGVVRPHTPSDAELAVARAALTAAPSLPMYARVDLVELAGGPAVMELELIEPELFLPYHPDAADRYAREIADLI